MSVVFIFIVLSCFYFSGVAACFSNKLLKVDERFSLSKEVCNSDQFTEHKYVHTFN